MKIHQYRNYAHYVRAQTEANREKIDHVWVSEQSIETVVDHYGPAKSVLCHGTRNAAEQLLFLRHYPDARILGSEIADTAWQFPMTVQWDMQHHRSDWVGCFDIVYSNSIDHAIYPEKAIRTWLSQLSAHGCLYIDHASAPQNNVSSETDPLEIDDEELATMIENCGGEIDAVLEGSGGNRNRTQIYAVQ